MTKVKQPYLPVSQELLHLLIVYSSSFSLFFFFCFNLFMSAFTSGEAWQEFSNVIDLYEKWEKWNWGNSKY